jgi:hypothetical protein
VGIFRRPRVHLIPKADYIDHETETDCVCGPEVEEASHQVVVRHWSLDGREKRKK